MFFKKLSNGKYRYYEKFYDESEGKWKQASVTLVSKTRQAQGEAKRLLERKINKKLCEDEIINNIDKKTVQEVYDEYLFLRKEELKDSSFVVYEQTIKFLLKPILHKRIRSVTSSYFQNKLLQSSNSAIYKRSQKTYLHLFFEYSKKVGYIEKNPMDRVELPRERKSLQIVERKRAKFLSKEEFYQLKKSFGNKENEVRMNCLIEFMFLTGLRVGEALALIHENVDIDHKSIFVKYNIDYHSSNLKKFKLTTPKTRESYRQISINNRCVEILTKMMDLNAKIKPLDDRFIFLCKTGNLISVPIVNGYLKKIGNIADIEGKNPKDFSSHMLRHSHISLLTELGISLKAIMNRVGHIDEKTTIQIYTHVTQKMNVEIDEKLDNF